VLLFHGNPSWCYLYRLMLPGLVARGHRVLAPDLMGMGRSDKPVDPDVFTMDAHLDWLGQWLEGEDVRGATLFCQDWGGTLGLCLLADHGDRFDRVVAANTGLPAGEGVNKFMEQWLAFSQSVEELPVGSLVAGGTTRALGDDERAAYDAPFPDGTYQASAKRFPLLIPLQPDNPGVPRARASWAALEHWEKPFLTAFGSADAIAYRAGAHRRLQERIPGAAGQSHVVFDGANHFLQEDVPDELVVVIDDFVHGRSTRDTDES
jgi:haloalkane dehalogenase